jgi:type VI secretion system secreted protein Hcp
MAIDTHIKFDGIDGESTHKDHKGEIDVLSWSWGLTRAANPSTGGGAGVSKAVPGEFRIVHSYDKASPLLAKTAAAGKHIKMAVLMARKAGEGQKDFLKVTMKEVFITSVQASAGDQDGIAEEVALSYASIDFSYAPLTSKGALGTPVTFDWNIKTGRVT